MLLLTASAIALLLGAVSMPWRSLGSADRSNAVFIVTVVAGSTFLGIGFGGIALSALMLLAQ